MACDLLHFLFPGSVVVVAADKLLPLARHWLELHNARLDPIERARMATLDLELRRMAPEWPAGDARRAQQSGGGDSVRARQRVPIDR